VEEILIDDAGNVRFECYISESKLTKATNLSKMQGQFADAFNTQKEFSIRSISNGPLKQKDIIEVKAAKRINGPDESNSSFTEFKNNK